MIRISIILSAAAALYVYGVYSFSLVILLLVLWEYFRPREKETTQKFDGAANG